MPLVRLARASSGAARRAVPWSTLFPSATLFRSAVMAATLVTAVGAPIATATVRSKLRLSPAASDVGTALAGTTGTAALPVQPEAGSEMKERPAGRVSTTVMAPSAGGPPTLVQGR